MNKHEKVKDLLDGFDTGMLVTRAYEGALHARPMHVAHTDESGDVWFLTTLTSGLTTDLAKSPRVCVTFAKSGKFLSVDGSATTTTDRAQLERIWSSGMKPWFPDGIETPDICAVHISADSAEYWDNSGLQGIKVALEIARAVTKGERATPESNDVHGRVSL